MKIFLLSKIATTKTHGNYFSSSQTTHPQQMQQQHTQHNKRAVKKTSNILSKPALFIFSSPILV